MKTSPVALLRFLVACLLALLAVGSAQAATITVNSFLDDGANCTLRKAIENANAGSGVHAACTAGSAGPNTIVLGTGTYLFTANPNGPFNLVNHNITFQGNGPANTFIDGQNQDYIFDNFDYGGMTTAITMTFSDLTIRNGQSPGFSGFDVAGALFVEVGSTAVLNNVVFTNNITTASGGAIANYGTMTINDATFSGNRAGSGSAGEGGAIRNAGTLTVTNSTFSGNQSYGWGGAIYHTGDVAGEFLNVTNSTFSGNTAGVRGGAIAANNPASAGAITLTHVTIAGNSATTAGGGLYKNQSAAFNIDRSIIANNTAPTGPDCNANGAQSISSLNYNVLSTSAGCTISGTTTNNFVGALTLNALANNGGPTQTISLPAYSPARDRAPTCATPTDQRGTARPLGAQCDSGAFEASATVPDAPTIGAATAGNAQASVAFTAPSNDGGSPITGYTATSNPGGITASGAGSPLVVTGLTNNQAYTFTVRATNANGQGPPSAPSNSVTPMGPPASPRSGFNGDLRSDILWRDSLEGRVYQWQMNGLSLSGQGYMNTVPSNWAIAGVGDVNGDGNADVFWREAAGLNYIWIVNDLAISSGGYVLTVPNPWIVTGLGDADGDGKADVFWRNPSSGDNYLWLMNGLAVASQGYLPNVAGPDWEAVGVGDYSGDGKADVLWRNKATGQNYLWVMNGLVVAAQGFMPAVNPTDWEVAGSPDADGDGKADVLWRNKTSGQNYLWIMNGLTVSSQGYLPTIADANWKIVGYGDYNGDGRGDVLWRNATTGQNYLWTLNGISVATQGYLPSVSGANWTPIK